MQKKIWKFSAILSIGLLLVTVVQKSRAFFCIQGQGIYAIGTVNEIRGRKTNTVEHADFSFIINQKKFTGSTMLTGEKEFKKSINIGDKFLVLFCSSRPKYNVLILSHPLPKNINKLGEVYIDSTKVEFSILDL